MEDQGMVAVFAVLSFAIYFGAGYGVAWIFRAEPAWRIAVGVGLPVVLFAICWWHDLHDDGPHGFIPIPARGLWLMPGIFLLRMLIAH
ncbi:MAG: hypothetical protein HYX27_12730 [Acidobacteria bacterium]|nr:hypothetical protein [Acidobacteriota bacterium]